VLSLPFVVFIFSLRKIEETIYERIIFKLENFLKCE
jgi:hypothetical protein